MFSINILLVLIDCLGDLGVGENIILECVLKKKNGRAWTGFISVRVGTSAGLV
jgi:hypothetical protein